MRTVRFAMLCLLGLVLVVVGVANMTPVDVFLLPAGVGLPAAEIRDMPLSAVIFVSVLAGIIVGQLLEWVREAKHRRMVAEKHAEVGRLRKEIKRLSRRLGEGEDDLPKLTASR
ncbi:MAG: LapA family protein [Pikeienuella sp.]